MRKGLAGILLSDAGKRSHECTNTQRTEKVQLVLFTFIMIVPPPKKIHWINDSEIGLDIKMKETHCPELGRGEGEEEQFETISAS